MFLPCLLLFFLFLVSPSPLCSISAIAFHSFISDVFPPLSHSFSFSSAYSVFLILFITIILFLFSSHTCTCFYLSLHRQFHASLFPSPSSSFLYSTLFYIILNSVPIKTFFIHGIILSFILIIVFYLFIFSFSPPSLHFSPSTSHFEYAHYPQLFVTIAAFFIHGIILSFISIIFSL